MKILKDPGQVLQIMNRKLNELRKKFDEADGEEASEISGQEVAIIAIAGHIRHALKGQMATSGWKTWRVSMNTLTTLKKMTTSTVIPETLGS